MLLAALLGLHLLTTSVDDAPARAGPQAAPAAASTKPSASAAVPIGPSAPGKPARLVDNPLVLYYWPGGERLAHRLLELARAQPSLPALPEDVIRPGDTVHVYLAPDEARFDSLTGGRAPEWGAGIAYPDAGVIVLPGYISSRAAPHELARILRHELAHIALNRFLAPARAPRWFDEGYARWAAGEWDLEAAWQLRLAFALDRAPPLDSISLDWPRAAADARIAYLLSTTAIVYLVEQSGVHGLRVFLERWKESGNLDTALRQTFGFSLAQFEEAWRREVRSRYGWTLFLAHTLVFWAIVALLLLLLGIRRRRYDLERMERLRAEELPDSPAYWLGEEDS